MNFDRSFRPFQDVGNPFVADPFKYQAQDFTRVSMTVDRNQSVRKFQIRFTDISDNIELKEGRLESEDFTMDSYVT